MFYLKSTVLILITCLSLAIGQSFSANKNIPLSAQLFSYKDPGANRYLTEISISFSQSQLNLANESKNDTIDIISEIYSQDKMIVRGWHWFPLETYLKDNIKDVFLDQFTFAVDPGTYQLVIKVKNRSASNSLEGEISDQITIDNWDIEKASSSSILVSDLITKPQPDQDRFIKNGVFVQPYPVRTFSVNKPLMFYYWEIYNIENSKNKNRVVKASAIDGQGKTVRKLPNSKVHIASNNQAFCIAGQNIIALKDGNYKIKLEYYEDDAFILSRESAKIRVIKSKPAPQVLAKKDNIDPIYFAMTEAEIDDEIHFVRHIMNEKTWQSMKVMDYNNKRITLTRFWRANDFNKNTDENEFKSQYLNLVDYVRETYSDRDNDGVDTEMGRVILVYGKPDYINRKVDDETARQSVEYWRYNNYQAFFLFVQENFVGPYFLVHSSMRGEISDPKWQNYLDANYDLVNY